MHALVTGGAGFIGSHLANKLLDQGANITIVDNLSTGSESSIPAKCGFIFLDITENDFIIGNEPLPHYELKGFFFTRK